MQLSEKTIAKTKVKQYYFVNLEFILRKQFMRLKSLFCLIIIIFVISINGQTDNQRISVRTEDGKTKDVLLYTGSYALIIGNSNYDYWDKLSGVKTDVSLVDEALKKEGFQTETAFDLKSGELERKVQKFINDYGYNSDNRLLIYFAGHGDTRTAVDGRERGYIIPVDTPKYEADQLNFRRKAVSMDTIENWAREIETKHALFVFDSCFSGKLVSRAGVKLPAFIEESLTFPARQFITSGAKDQKVSDDSYFRRMFVAGLEGDADYNGDGYVNVTELAYFLKDRVTQYTNRSQTPQYGTLNNPDLDRGDMIFRVPENRRRNNEAKAEAAWKNVEKNNPEALRVFIGNYPNTKRSLEAIELIKKYEPQSVKRNSETNINPIKEIPTNESQTVNNSSSQKPKLSTTVGDLTFDIQSCEKSENNLACKVSIFNNGDNDMSIEFFNSTNNGNIRMITDFGRIWHSLVDSDGNEFQSAESVQKGVQLVSGVRTTGTVYFKVNRKISKIALLSIYYYVNGMRQEPVKFRHISVSKLD